MAQQWIRISMKGCDNDGQRGLTYEACDPGAPKSTGKYLA
jgi:hypothetical protein